MNNSQSTSQVFTLDIQPLLRSVCQFILSSAPISETSFENTLQCCPLDIFPSSYANKNATSFNSVQQYSCFCMACGVESHGNLPQYISLV